MMHDQRNTAVQEEQRVHEHTLVQQADADDCWPTHEVVSQVYDNRYCVFQSER